jgi:hypothetical protein
MKAMNIAMCVMAAALLAAGSVRGADDNNRIGVGARYWQTIDNIDVDRIDEDGFTFIASYQHWFGLLGMELAVEWYKKGFAGSPDDIYAPQALLLVGKGIYAAAGIGGYFRDGEFADEPFYVLRAGLNFEVLPSLYLDINANYRFENTDDLERRATDIDTDTVSLGAAVRMAF